MSVRTRRLTADYERICTAFGSKGRIRLLKAIGEPPEKYQIEFLVTSVQMDPTTKAIRTHNSFIAEIVLTGAYPRLAPQCRMLTPVFHPNIAPHAICIGDHWAAGESVSHLIVRIAEMLAFQSYNVKSPLNGEAARWVEKNQDNLPLDRYDFASLLSAGAAVGRNEDGSLKAGGECANCGKKAGAEPMYVCINQHVTCANCKLECALCKSTMCLKCPVAACATCGRRVCTKCILRCRTCGRLVCKDHAGACHVCKQPRCTDCLVECDVCGKPACLEHITKVVVDGEKKYHCKACAS